MPKELATADQKIARLAARQHGVVSIAQLIAAGLQPSAVTLRLNAGRLHRVYRGVYAVGHAALSNEGRWLAAVLVGGECAVLSHRSAAELWKLLPASGGPVEVTVPGRSGRAKRQGLRIHHSSSLLFAVTTRRDGIALTAPARTIADLQRTASPEDVRRAIRQANFVGLEFGQ